MAVFDFIVTLFESFILSSFIIIIFDFEKKKKASLILTSLYFIETYFFNAIYINNALLFFAELITTLLYVYISYKTIKFIHVFVTCYGMAIISISVAIAILVSSFILDLPVDYLKIDNNFYFLATILSKIINFILIILSIKMIKKKENNLLLNQWWLLLLFLSLIILVVIVLVDSIAYNKYSIGLIIFVLICLLIILCISIIIFYKINSENEKKIEMIKLLVKKEYIDKNYQKMNYLYNATTQMNHRMMYLMIRMRHIASKEKNMKMIHLLNNEIKRIDKYQILKPTSNPYFDFRIREKLDELKYDGYHIKTVFQLDELSLLSQESIVDDIINAIEWIAQASDPSQQLSIYITHKNDYLILNLRVCIVDSFITNYGEPAFINDHITSHVTIDNEFLNLDLLIHSLDGDKYD